MWCNTDSGSYRNLLTFCHLLRSRQNNLNVSTGLWSRGGNSHILPIVSRNGTTIKLNELGAF
ncbi:hypothetical protein HaloA020_36550 [Halomonas sp. A020]|nr:hypothetical protein HaloA020_36550 [Halomonas sp. A020]